MHDFGVVDAGNGVRERGGQGGDSSGFDEASREEFCEGGAGDVLADDEGLGGVDFDVDDVGDAVSEDGVHCACFAQEACAGFFGGGERRVEEFEGNPLPRLVAGKPDRGGSSGSEAFE